MRSSLLLYVKGMLLAVFLISQAFSFESFAQTLSKGDIAIIGMSTSTTNNDEFSWVTLVNLTGGTKIYFTDAGYNTKLNKFIAGSNPPAAPSPNTQDGLYRYTVPSAGIPAGSMFTLDMNAPMPSDYTAVSGTNFGNDMLLTLANSGDNITVFQSTDLESSGAAFGTANITIIYQATLSTLDWAAYTDATIVSTDQDKVTNLHPQLVHVNGSPDCFIALGIGAGKIDEYDDARYEGPTSGSKTDLLNELSKLNNWKRENPSPAVLTRAVGWTRSGFSGSFTVAGAAPPPSITTNPINVSVCAGTGASFSVTATDATSYQWQLNTGSGYTNISDGGIYSGAENENLSISSASAGMNGYKYRCIATGTVDPTATSSDALLTVSPAVAYYQDTDGDGYGNPSVIQNSCTGGFTGYVTDNTDCDDANATINPGSSVWSGAINNLWSNPANWSCGTLPTAASNVTINAAANMPVVDIANAACNNLTIGAGASLTINSGQVLNIRGTVLNIGGFAAIGKATFSGTNQVLPGGSYVDLEIAGSGAKTLSAPATINGVFTLTASNLELGSNDLTIGNSGSISGGNVSSYIITNGDGILKQGNIGVGGRSDIVVFPVGTSASYTPLSIKNAGMSDEFGVKVINGVFDTYGANDGPTGAPQNDNNVNKTWSITESIAGGSNVTLGFQWNGSDEQPGFNRSAATPSHYTSSAWRRGPTSAASGANPYTISMSGITSFSPFGIGSANSILPLTLLSFTGKEVIEGISLQWTTAHEMNTAGFDIERSTNNGDFITVGSMVAKAAHAYHYTDKKALAGSVYMYRLKMRDMDGKYAYSAIIAVNYAAKAATAYAVYPNPATGAYLYVKPLSGASDNIQFTISDMTGRIWHSGKLTAGAMSSGHFEIPVKQLPAGSYVIKISDKNEERLQATKFTIVD